MTVVVSLAALQAHKAEQMWARGGYRTWRVLESKYPDTTAEFTAGLRIPTSSVSATGPGSRVHEHEELHQRALTSYFKRVKPQVVRCRVYVAVTDTTGPCSSCCACPATGRQRARAHPQVPP